MGYNVYITRRKNHYDEDGPIITADEWASVVDKDPTLTMRSDDPRTADWAGECKYGNGTWFAHCRIYGSIDTKNPDEPILAKMLELAAILNARVQGDDGEIYVSPTETYYEESDDVATRTKRSPWWRRLFGT